MARPKLSEAEKKANAEARELAKKEKLAKEKAAKELREKKELEKEQVPEDVFEELEEADDNVGLDLDAVFEEDLKKEALKKQEEAMAHESLKEDLAWKTSTPKRKKKNELDRNMLVPVVSMVVGTLIYKSDRTGATYMFKGFGSEDDIELFELQAMRSAYPKFLMHPWLFILDKEVVDYLGLTDFYTNVLNPRKMEMYFKLNPDRIKNILQNAPRGFQETVVDQARLMIKSGKLDSVERIKAIEDVMKVKLQDED